jgi:hypothetical protein
MIWNKSGNENLRDIDIDLAPNNYLFLGWYKKVFHHSQVRFVRRRINQSINQKCSSFSLLFRVN